MSICTRASSSPNMNSARALASSVLPTPVGPAKTKQPVGRLGSFRPLRLRRTAFEIDLIASSWLTTRLCSSLFHLHQPHRVLGGHARQRDAGHLRDHLGDHLLVDHAVGLAGFLPPLVRDQLLLLLQLVGLVAQGGRLLEVLVGDRLFLLLVEVLDLVVDFLQVGRPGHRLQVHAGARLVDHVDGLVRQAAAGDVAARQLDGRLDGVVGDLHVVVLLVAVAEPLEDFDGLLLRRRARP